MEKLVLAHDAMRNFDSDDYLKLNLQNDPLVFSNDYKNHELIRKSNPIEIESKDTTDEDIFIEDIPETLETNNKKQEKVIDKENKKLDSLLRKGSKLIDKIESKDTTDEDIFIEDIPETLETKDTPFAEENGVPDYKWLSDRDKENYHNASEATKEYYKYYDALNNALPEQYGNWKGWGISYSPVSNILEIPSIAKNFFNDHPELYSEDNYYNLINGLANKKFGYITAPNGEYNSNFSGNVYWNLISEYYPEEAKELMKSGEYTDDDKENFERITNQNMNTFFDNGSYDLLESYSNNKEDFTNFLKDLAGENNYDYRDPYNLIYKSPAAYDILDTYRDFYIDQQNQVDSYLDREYDNYLFEKEIKKNGGYLNKIKSNKNLNNFRYRLDI